MKKLVLILLAISVALLSGCRDRPPPNTVHSPDDVRDKLIGAIDGTPSLLLAEDLGVARAFSTGSELMYHLKSGALDCVIMENTVAAELVSETSGVRVLSDPLIEYDLYFAVAKENAELLKAVNSALTALRDNGTLNGLLAKYFSGKNYTYVPPDNVVQRPGYLSLAVPPDSPPYSYKNAYGDFTGLDIDVARAVCDHLGVELQIIGLDTRELVTSVWFGKADLALGWLPVEGEDIVAISDSYANAVQVVIVRR